MRVTQKLMTESAIQYMQDNLERLNSLQDRVSSGKQFQYASENPSGATIVLSLRSTLETSQGYLDTANVTESWVSANDFTLGKTLDVAKRAVNLALEGVSDTLGQMERLSLGAEMDMVLQQALTLGNTSHQGSYIFSGFRTSTLPFEAVDNNADGLYDTVNYNGDTGIILRTVSPGQNVAQNLVGSAVFSPLFAAIISARDALNANDTTALQASLSDLKDALATLTEATTTNGARQRQVRLIRDRIEMSQTEIKSLISLKEDTNMAEAIAHLRNQETAYQAVLEVSQRTLSALNLFQIMG